MFNDKAWEFISLPGIDPVNMSVDEKGHKTIWDSIYEGRLHEIAIFYASNGVSEKLYGPVEGYYLRKDNNEFFVNLSDAPLNHIWANGKAIEVPADELEKLVANIPDGRLITSNEYVAIYFDMYNLAVKYENGG